MLGLQGFKVQPFCVKLCNVLEIVLLFTSTVVTIAVAIAINSVSTSKLEITCIISFIGSAIPVKWYHFVLLGGSESCSSMTTVYLQPNHASTKSADRARIGLSVQV